MDRCKKYNPPSPSRRAGRERCEVTLTNGMDESEDGQIAKASYYWIKPVVERICRRLSLHLGMKAVVLLLVIA